MHHHAQLLLSSALYILRPTSCFDEHKDRKPKDPSSFITGLPRCFHHDPRTYLRPYHHPIRSENNQNRNRSHSSAKNRCRVSSFDISNGGCSSRWDQTERSGEKRRLAWLARNLTSHFLMDRASVSLSRVSWSIHTSWVAWVFLHRSTIFYEIFSNIAFLGFFGNGILPKLGDRFDSEQHNRELREHSLAQRKKHKPLQAWLLLLANVCSKCS